jgi:hypothetical protein
LFSNEPNELVRLCDEKIGTYLQKRGTAVYDHWLRCEIDAPGNANKGAAAY